MSEAPRKVEQAASGLDELKSLLFQGEARRLDEIERHVAHLDQRVGDAPRLVKATAEILVEALRDAEVTRHRELAAAVAPVVVAAIRNEIKNSKEMMVEALYPLTGQLVVAAVHNAFRELVASLNQRVDALTSVDRWKLTLRSKLTGKQVSELALAQTARGRVTRVLFVEAGSGVVLANWRADLQPDDRAEMVGGLIAALTGFARDALDAGANELRTLDLGGRKTYLRNSPRTIFAAEIEGELTAAQIAELDGGFLKLIEAQGRNENADDKVLAAFSSQINEAAAPVKKAGAGLALKIIAILLLAVLSGFAIRSGLRWWKDLQINNAIAEVVAQRPQLAAFPISASARHSEGNISVQAILPGMADADALVAALKAVAGDYSVDPQFVFVATVAGVDTLVQRASTIERQTTELQARLETLTRNSASATEVIEMQARLDFLARAGASNAQVDDLRTRVESVANAGAPASLVADLRTRIDLLGASAAETRRLNERVSELTRKLGQVTMRLETPRARLAALVDGVAIFFSDRNVAIEDVSAMERIAAIADLLKSESLGVRVVGHSDASGTARTNLAVSRARADAVVAMLVARGVERSAIIVASRSTSLPISDPDSAARERNRRVTFETLYDNEVAP